MATDSRGHAPGTTLQTDIPSGRLIIDRVDDPLEFRGAHRRYQSIGGSNPSVPILSSNDLYPTDGSLLGINQRPISDLISVDEGSVVYAYWRFPY